MSLKKLSTLSEITLKPAISSIYLRFVTVLYFLTFLLLIQSSVPVVIKGLIILWMSGLLRRDWRVKMPGCSIKSIQFTGNSWILTLNQQTGVRYEQVQVLVHNELFQLLQFKSTMQKKLIVLFQDQLTSHEWRLLYLKIAQN